jgi:ABC-type polysaccharide/polyol phosphate transport system ATPase subunit
VTSVAFRSVSKSYPIYKRPSHRLLELLSFNSLKRHDDYWALRDASFEIAKGDVFCLVGENGSGKSTTLQLAAQIFPPTEGEVEINGRVSALLELGAGFNPEFSGRDNVFLSGTVLGLSTQEIKRRYRHIEAFAEIGAFIDQPVKTYSSGMLVRLAFAVAINVEPDILLVDEALAVGDYYFRQRCMRKVHELRKREVTILFVSHAMADVKALGTLCAWLENGRIVEMGRPDAVVPRYLGRMTEKDAEYLARRESSAASVSRAATLAPEIVEGIPNVDHRHGNGAAEIIGIAALDEAGRRLEELQPSTTFILRISVRALRPVAAPNIGFMMRNHLGLDLAGTNTAREGVELEAMQPGDITTVDFHLDLPELYPGHFSFSPAVADGDYLAYEMADWIDNALAFEMSHRGKPIYGYVHLPCRVEVNARLGKPAAAIES